MCALVEDKVKTSNKVNQKKHEKRHVVGSNDAQDDSLQNKPVTVDITAKGVKEKDKNQRREQNTETGYVDENPIRKYKISADGEVSKGDYSENICRDMYEIRNPHTNDSSKLLGNYDVEPNKEKKRKNKEKHGKKFKVHSCFVKIPDENNTGVVVEGQSCSAKENNAVMKNGKERVKEEEEDKEMMMMKKKKKKKKKKDKESSDLLVEKNVTNKDVREKEREFFEERMKEKGDQRKKKRKRHEKGIDDASKKIGTHVTNVEAGNIQRGEEEKKKNKKKKEKACSVISGAVDLSENCTPKEASKRVRFSEHVETGKIEKEKASSVISSAADLSENRTLKEASKRASFSEHVEAGNIEKKKKKKKKEKASSVISGAVGLSENCTPEEAYKRVRFSEHVEADNGENEKKRRKKKKEKASSLISGTADISENCTPKEASKRVSFSEHVEFFPSSDILGNEKNGDLVRGKRFSRAEDNMVKKAVLDYIDEHGLGEGGLDMVLHCKSHPEVRNCWKEIAMALPWRPLESIYYRAHILFERDDSRTWTPEEFDYVRKYVEKYGNKWRELADEMGKHRFHVKDTWRRIKVKNRKVGPWSQEEYQTLFDYVNMDLRLKASEERKSKHGMLRDNICWEEISEKLSTRSNAICCMKWYRELTSPMVTEGKWADADDYRLVTALVSMDACCMEDVDWDNLLEHRSGDLCRKRWKQMVNHLGYNGNKTFAEQVEVLAKRYCPDLLETRETYDGKPAVDQC